MACSSMAKLGLTWRRQPQNFWKNKTSILLSGHLKKQNKSYRPLFWWDSYKVCQKETDSRMGTENMPQEGFSRDFYDNLILLIQIHYIVKEIPKK